jgi:hypothetical protein
LILPNLGKISMKSVGSILILFLLPMFLFSQDLTPPAVKNNYARVTSYEELSAYVQLLDEQSDLLKVEVIGQSVQGRNLYALMFSASKFGKDKSRIRVMIFAQQHGNEQSGKEGALLLAEDLLKNENRYLFDKIDFLLIPQVNPDGSEINERFNANGADLNRNHLILTEPETQALHRIFDQYLFEVSMDVHEYSPYGDEWKNYGYRKNSDVTLGTTTNLNVSREIRNLSGNGYLPFIFRYLNDREFSSFEYSPGGPPEINYIRHSTFDINDGRQSLGIQNTFSFIQEGMNGSDNFAENLGHRAAAQFAGMRGMLEYAYLNKDEIKNLVTEERKKLISGNHEQLVSIQSNHVKNGEKLELPLFSYYSGKDTIVTVEDFRPEVKSIYDVKKPTGYLIPKELTALTDWAKRHSFAVRSLTNSSDYIIEQYLVHGIDTIDFEGDPTVNPQITIQEIREGIDTKQYIFIPTDQLKGNMIILALEPKSELGLVTYKNYADLLKTGEVFPVLRVLKRK